MANMRSSCVYAALSANQLVGMSASLETLIERVCDEWDLGGEDVTVWEQRETGALRLVAAVRAQPGGSPSVTWFGKSVPQTLAAREGTW